MWMHVGLILLKRVGSDIGAESLWSSINSLNLDYQESC